ncbi:DUF6527 family protein [Maribacter sp. ACAM166]|uniref:DUF6527 family protein n=1 Tax=Maribacter sp. ACAM166 TaxID=2508996 RepID=UPI0026BDE123
MKQLFKWILSFFTKESKAFKLKIVSELPKEPVEHTLYLEGNVKEDDYWYALLKCPCGCGDNIMLNLMTDSKPCWEVKLINKHPSVFPSIWRTKNCKSHFWVKEGKIFWS